MRVLIVDDEPLARRGLRLELERIPGMICAGECRGRDEAVTAIVEQQPDCVLLDVQLGRATAFEIIEQVGVDAMPFVVFVTAYDRHALRAFQVNAIDYVLKPVDPERLREALERVARQQSLEQSASLADRLEQLLAKQVGGLPTPAEVARPPERLVVHDGTRLAFVDVSAIDWIEAYGNYVRVHAGLRHYLVRATMTRMAQRLGDRGDPGASGTGAFVRIRRSALVNIHAIVTAERYGKGMFTLRLRNGAQLVSSRYHQAGLNGLLRPDAGG
jgi:two-component system, LytTR family, response regulator